MLLTSIVKKGHSRFFIHTPYLCGRYEKNNRVAQGAGCYERRRFEGIEGYL
jgi:hypothetical protein